MNEFDRMASKKYEEKERKKKSILIGIVICIILIIVFAVFIVYFQYVDAHTFKLFINGSQKYNQVAVNEGFYFTNENGITYVRAKDVASYIGWSYQNGEYGSYTEDSNSGYIQNGYEVASFVVGSNTLKKYIQITAQPYQNEVGETVQPYEANSQNGTLETFNIDYPIISQENQVYFPLTCLNDICNCSVSYENPYRMYIDNQDYLLSLAQIYASNFGFESVSGTYENIRLLSYGMMVVGRNSMFGVVNLYNGQSIIGLKYTDMVFSQNSKEFFVKTISNDEESIGIIDIQGNQVIAPQNYSNIQVLNDELGLYLVEKNEKYGVLDKTGEEIVFCEYDSIGFSDELIEKFHFSVEDDKYLLFNNTILVEKDGRYGLYNIDGDQTLETKFVGIGYDVTEDKNAEKNTDSVLTIELEDLQLSDGSKRDVKAIIIKQQETDGSIKYGVYDAESSKLILPCIYDRIYSITSKGKTEYFIVWSNLKIDFSEQLIQNPGIF